MPDDLYRLEREIEILKTRIEVLEDERDLEREAKRRRHALIDWLPIVAVWFVAAIVLAVSITAKVVGQE